MKRNKLESLMSGKFSKLKADGIQMQNNDTGTANQPPPVMTHINGSGLGTKYSFEGDIKATYGGTNAYNGHYEADYAGKFIIDGVVGHGTWTPWKGFEGN